MVESTAVAANSSLGVEIDASTTRSVFSTNISTYFVLAPLSARYLESCQSINFRRMPDGTRGAHERYLYASATPSPTVYSIPVDSYGVVTEMAHNLGCLF
jgi:hypothetical protein